MMDWSEKLTMEDRVAALEQTVRELARQLADTDEFVTIAAHEALTRAGVGPLYAECDG